MVTRIRNDQKWINGWLLVGVVMVFVQILLGGITRLTGSGLSITKWDIVTGVLPPFTKDQWQQNFDLYKTTPQYQKINEGMSLNLFKHIFFWEYFHRLWARSMGIIFIIPFFLFIFRKSLSRQTLIRLSVVIGFAVLAALFGWLMVVSGLVDRPWVNAYNLTLHLLIGIGLLLSLVYTWLAERNKNKISIPASLRIWLYVLFFMVIFQITLGGMVSGMKSALNYPTWPKMQGEWIPSILKVASNWNMQNLTRYDSSAFMPALVQVVHRNTAYLISLLSLFFSLQWIRKNSHRKYWIAYFLLGTIVVQLFLGIMTLVHSIGEVPVFFGVLHQAMGILLLTFLFYLLTTTTPQKQV